jgi:DNA primase small subunit
MLKVCNSRRMVSSLHVAYVVILCFTEDPSLNSNSGSSKRKAESTVVRNAGDVESEPKIPVVNANAAKQEAFNHDWLSYYYRNLFPFQEMFRWLSYGNDPDSSAAGIDRSHFSRREISFTLAGEVYIRYQDFRDAAEFEKAVTDKCPEKIDIGPLYDQKPSRHKTTKLVPLERELIFDIDMTDYDNIRVCCSGANICQRCWAFMNVAIKVLDRSLRTDFGFQHIMYVYSGRRGVHAWVCDVKARFLTDEERGAIVQYLTAENDDATSIAALNNGNKEENDVVSLYKKILNGLTDPIHPSLKKAYDELEPMFVKWVISENGQRLLADPKLWQTVLDMIPVLPDGFPDLKNLIGDYWAKKSVSPEKRWNVMKATISEYVSPKDAKKQDQNKLPKEILSVLKKILVAVVFTYTYPRLDVNVSKQRNHLLKSPFVIHPKTGRVCVPIDISEVDSFDPTKVPTVSLLVEQGQRHFFKQHDANKRNAADDSNGDVEAVAKLERRKKERSEFIRATDLGPYVSRFESFVRECEMEAKNLRKSAEEETAAATGGW